MAQGRVLMQCAFDRQLSQCDPFDQVMPATLGLVGALRCVLRSIVPLTQFHASANAEENRLQG
jgi:hypothetical protein